MTFNDWLICFTGASVCIGFGVALGWWARGSSDLEHEEEAARLRDACERVRVLP